MSAPATRAPERPSLEFLVVAAARMLGTIRSGEGPTVALLAAAFGALEAGRGLGEVGVNALVLSRLPADALPWLFIPLGVLSLLVSVALGAALGRFRRHRLIPLVLAGTGLLLAAESVVLLLLDGPVPVAWVTVMAAGALAVTLSWAVAGATLDARQAKRLFPICTAAAIAGSFAGSLGAGPLARLVGTSVLVGVQGILFALAAWAVARLARRGVGAGWRPLVGRRRLVDEVRTGFDEVRHSPLLRMVAVAYVLFAVLLFSVSYPYLIAARSAFPDEQRLAAVLGIVSALVTALSFLVSLFVADRFYRRLGIAAAALLLPLVYLIGFSVWLISFTFATAAIVTVLQQVVQRGLSNAAWSAFYNVAPAARRAQALAFNDGVPGQLGIVLSGVLLVVATRYLAPTQIFWMGLVAAAACTATVLAVRRRYGDALLRALRGGPGERVLEGPADLGSALTAPDAHPALAAAVRSTDPATRELAVSLLALTANPATDLAALLDDPDPAVRGAVARSLLGHGHDRGAQRVVDELLGGDRAARLAGLRALDALGRPLDRDRMALLDDPDQALRAAAVRLLAHDPAGSHAARTALDDGTAAVRRAAAAVLAAGQQPDPIVLQRLSGEADDETVLALTGHPDPAVRRAVSGWAHRRVARALDLAACRTALADLGTDESGRFLIAVLDDRIRAGQRSALLAMSVLGAREAAGVVRRGLGSTDPEVRGQALEAVESVGDRRLGAAVAGLVEGVRPTADAADLLDRLRDDDDLWVRVAARRTGSDVVPVADEPAAPAPAAIATMLLLRRVPLFAGLGPDDLHRIAVVSHEESFADREALVVEGEPGDSLFVLESGSVRVVRIDAGVERELRRYGEGDHVGELAVLRQQPRSATVIADGPVRARVVDGDSLAAILRERPDAAMALLATLAERISAQP